MNGKPFLLMCLIVEASSFGKIFDSASANCIGKFCLNFAGLFAHIDKVSKDGRYRLLNEINLFGNNHNSLFLDFAN